MESRPITQAELAKEVDLTQVQISRFLAGQSPKSVDLYKLARFFEVSMEWLLVGQESRDRESLRVKEAQMSYKPVQKLTEKGLDEILKQMEGFTEQMKKAREKLED